MWASSNAMGAGVLAALGVIVAPAGAHAEVTPAALPPVIDGGWSTTIAATVTEERRALGFQFGVNDVGLFQVGVAAAIDDERVDSSVQGNLAAGFRIRLVNAGLGTAGRLRVSLVARGVAEGVVTPFGASEAAGRAGVDGGISAWLMSPTGSSGGILIGAGHPFVGGETHGTEVQISGMMIMALDEPEMGAPAREAAAVDELLTTDPHKWPEGGPRAPSPNTDERTYLTVGLSFARGYQDDGTPDRLMLVVGVVYP